MALRRRFKRISSNLHRLDLLIDPIPTNFIHNSSHLFGIVEAIALARELHQLPSRLLLYGIEAKIFAAGAPLSSEVEGSVTHVVNGIVDEVTNNASE